MMNQFGTTVIIYTIEDLLLNVYRYRHCNHKLGNMYSKIKHEPSLNMQHIVYVIAERYNTTGTFYDADIPEMQIQCVMKRIIN